MSAEEAAEVRRHVDEKAIYVVEVQRVEAQKDEQTREGGRGWRGTDNYTQ